MRRIMCGLALAAGVVSASGQVSMPNFEALHSTIKTGDK